MPADRPDFVAEVPPPLQAYEYGDVPPDPLAVADPLLPPLQLTFVWDEMLAVTAVGSVMVTVSVSSQPFASVTVTVYVPAARLDAVAPVALFDQA